MLAKTAAFALIFMSLVAIDAVSLKKFQEKYEVSQKQTRWLQIYNS